MRSGMKTSAVFLIGIAMMVGCARQTEVVKLYEDPAIAGKSYKRLLIVAVSDARRDQENFENAIAEKLRARGVTAIPSHTMFTANPEILQQDIDRASAQAGADAILITHVAGVDSTAEIAEGRQDIQPECRGGDLADYFLYDYKVLRQPESVRMSHTVIVIANLHDAPSRERIWTIQSTCYDKASMSEVIVDEAEAIVRQMQIDRLI